ncbi:MAG: transmembrane anchor protein [Rhodospirillaceae bacterium]|jgi:hypothetical protein|nr:transmembrane anchor protein [Rhodospirillaceae bacterium]
MYNTDIPSREELPTTGTLLRSTFVAAIVAVILVFTTVLPAEYGIDPTGVGRLTGLAEMGKIKIQLEKEAEADRQKGPSATIEPKSRSSLVKRVFAAILIAPAAAHEAGHGPVGMPGATPGEAEPKKASGRTDEMSVTLTPGQGAEIKLRMRKGAKANYAWTADGGKVNFDKHGDGPGGAAKSYKRGRSVAGDDGVLEAAFNGNHGWFWRNRTKQNVTVKLWTNGDYTDIKRVM